LLYSNARKGVTGIMESKKPDISDKIGFYPPILTIQSAVMVGAVGNDAACPIYAHFRLKSARLDTVRLAAHPGFQSGHADITSPATLTALLRDFARLTSQHLPEAIQTGYFGSADQIAPVSDFIAQSQQKKGGFYLLDPVLGDSGRLYVDPAIASEMQHRLLPLADLITPNAFELAWLADRPVGTIKEAEQAAHHLLAKSSKPLQAVFATGIKAENDKIADVLVTRHATDHFLHSRKDKGISGSGDVLSALILAFYLQHKDLSIATRLASELIGKRIAETQTSLGLDIERLCSEMAD